MSVDLVGVKVENLRGYTSMYLPLTRPTTVVVGPNNSGKTSVLRLLNWLLNQTKPEWFEPSWDLPIDLARFLLPARHTKHKARRLHLELMIKDGRSHQRYKCVDGIASLRLNVRLTPKEQGYLALGDPVRGESRRSAQRAIELLGLLQESVRLIYVPSFRDAGSVRFAGTLSKSLDARIAQKASHAAVGGAPKEYRKIKKSLEAIAQTIEGLAQPLWTEVRTQLPPGLAVNGEFKVDCEVNDIVQWLSSRLAWKVATGAHDEACVPITELGSGLQSLLDLAVQACDQEQGNSQLLMVVEEPESFLHPSAQRVVARRLLRAQPNCRVIVTTHSAVVVEEARYGEVVVCRDQRFYYPRRREDSDREEINSALLSGRGAEMLFARSVLLVEGEGDLLYFEKLRRRLASVDGSGRMDQLFVVAAGGNSNFAPWIRLIESYGKSSDRPIHWLIAADGDAATQVEAALKHAGLTVPVEVGTALKDVGVGAGAGRASWTDSVRALNDATSKVELPVMLMPVDLEDQALSGCSVETWTSIATKAGITVATLDELLSALGSKAAGNGSGRKAPWIRGYCGACIPASEWSNDTREILRRWMLPVMVETEARALFAGIAASERALA